MTTEEQKPAEAESDGADSTEVAPALNRAQRRALAQGKKGAGGGSHAMPNSQQRGLGGKSGAKGGPAHFPRTGHK